MLGVPDATWGQAVRAVVVATAPVGLGDLRPYVASRLGAAHAPKQLVVVDRIERDGMGKINAAERARLSTAIPTEAYSPA